MFINIKVEMTKRGLKIANIAQVLGKSYNTTLSKINGKKEFTLTELTTLSKLFDCSIDYLIEQKK